VRIIVLLLVICFGAAASADEGKLAEKVRDLYGQKEYFHAITEAERYSFLYKGGKFTAGSLLLRGKAYFHGGNYDRASRDFGNCSALYGSRPEGEEALFFLGYMRLLKGSPLYAMRSFKQYLLRYEDSRFTERVHYYRIYNSAFMGDLMGARQRIMTYRHLYPQGAYFENLSLVDASIVGEINRPRKSLAIAVTGSLILPGFGHFYTGNYRTGFFSLLVNAAFISLTVHGAVTKNYYQAGLCGFIELQLYLYSVYGGVRDVQQYNSSRKFYRGLRLTIMQQEF